MSWRREIAKLGALFRRPRPVDDLEAEIRSHLQMEEQENLESGMSPEEARYAALRRFGNVTLAEERSREMWTWRSIETLAQDLRYGLRQLRRSPGFTAVAVITLALGIGANTAIFSLIDAVMLKTLPVEKPDELLQVKRRDPSWPGQASSYFTNSLWEQVRDHQDVFSGAFAWGDDKFDLAQGGAVHLANGIWVSGSFFSTLRLRPAAGRLIAASDDQRACPAVTALSYGFWQDHYGGVPSAVGSTLSLDGHPFEVIGVAPPGFFGIDTGQKFDVAIPICSSKIFDGKASRLEHRSWWWLKIAGRIKPGISRAQLTARLKVLAPPIFTAALPQDWSKQRQQQFVKVILQVDPAATGTSFMGQQFDQPLRVLMAVVGLVLLIACANIASLMLARGAARQREIAIRQAIGASRVRLIRQLLTECVLLAAAGAFVGILFARWSTVLLVRYLSTAGNKVFLDLSLDGRVLGFTVALAVLTGILFGLLPALRSTRVSLASAMKGDQASDAERRVRFTGRKWLVAGQLALSLVLLVAAGLLLSSFVKLAMLDIGFDRNNVLLLSANLKTAKVPPDQQSATFDEIEARLKALPGVVSVGRSIMTPISGFEWNNTILTDWSRAIAGDAALADFNYVSPGFFQTLSMPLVAGRDFNGGDVKTSAAVVVVNQTLVRRFFPNLSPIGKTLRIDDIGGKPGPPIEVVGVVKDSKYSSLREEVPPTAFFPITQIPEHSEGQTFELRTAIPPSAVVGTIQAAVASVNKQIPLYFGSLAEQVSDSMVQERLLALLSAFFGALALLMAMVGLYGVVSFVVTQRQAEFGIRMALGAEPSSILRLVMRDVAAILAVGVTAGTLIALATTRVLAGLLFGLGARDSLTLIIAIGVLSAVALIAGFIPARRATKVDPMVALRYE